MEFVELATTGLRLSRFVFGCEPLGGTDWGNVDLDKIKLAIRQAIAAGVNAFDVADVYGLGQAEKLLSKALGSELKTSVIITKFGLSWDASGPDQRAKITKNCSASWVRKALEGSLRRLGIDCIPIYLVHWPDPKTPLEETFFELSRFQKEGKVRCLGVSNFSVHELVGAASLAKLELVQSGFSLLNAKTGVPQLRAANELGLKNFVYGSLAQGLFSLKYSPHTQFASDDRRHRLPQFTPEGWERNAALLKRLSQLSSELGRLPEQVAMRWCLDQPEIDGVVVGVKNPEQLARNIASFDWQLESEQLNFLEQRLP